MSLDTSPYEKPQEKQEIASNNINDTGLLGQHHVYTFLLLFFVVFILSFFQYFSVSSATVSRRTSKIPVPIVPLGNPYSVFWGDDIESVSPASKNFVEGGVAGICGNPFSSDFPVLGDQKVMAILIDFAQNGSAQPLSDVVTGLFSSPNSVKKFIEAASFDKVTLSGDIFGWYPYPPLAGCTPTDAEQMGMMNLVPESVNFQDYSRLVFLFNGHGLNCPAGVSSLGKISMATPDGIMCVSRLWKREPFYLPNDFSQTTAKTLAHELLHSFGVPFHANAYVCPNAPLPANPAGCTIGAYGDLFDIMGLASQASHPNATIKEQLGWLNSSNTITVPEAPGEYTYTISSIAKAGSGPKNIVIELPNPVNMLGVTALIPAHKIAIEYRDMTGFDFRNTRSISLASGGVYSITNTNGALLRAVSCSLNGFCITDLLDMRPGSINEAYPPFEAADAYLYPGEEFAVTGNLIKIKTLSAIAGQSVTVKVTVAPVVVACPADLDGNVTVDGADLAILLGAFNTSGTNIVGDINTDGTANSADLALLLDAWGPCQ